MKHPEFNPGMVPDNDEVARLSPETSEGLEEADSYSKWESKGKNGEERGNFHRRKVLKKTPGGEDRRFGFVFCFLFLSWSYSPEQKLPM